TASPGAISTSPAPPGRTSPTTRANPAGARVMACACSIASSATITRNRTMAGELWFYHLERTTLGDALPELLDKTLAKGWRALVRAGSEGRAARIDQMLWSWRDEAFLPHGRWDEPDPERQPILLTLDEDNRNSAQALFTVDGVEPEQPDAFERAVVMFDA